MLVKTVVVCLSLAAALPASAAPAPLATSTVVRLPELITMTVGFVAPTEIPDPAPTSKSSASAHRMPGMDSRLPGISDAEEYVPGLSGMENNARLPVDASSLLRRQIRIDNYDATNNNMTQPLLGGAHRLLARGNKKAQKLQAAHMKTVQAAAQPTSAPAGGLPLGAATPMKAISSGVQGLGATRMESSDVFHKALGAAFDPMGALQDTSPSSTSTSSAPKATYSKTTNAEPLPVGPGYTTDTMDTVPEQAPPKSKQKRHSFMFDLNGLFPEPPSTTMDSLATPSPVQAWQNDALFELDSNRRPDPAFPHNVTSAATNVTGTAQGVAGNATKA
ncbi:uncharacterized protein B0H18DRAFT_951180 [Fomitopsis serialis]|uniref:uncharacterized protein n=1 Tax=Fomitopsis serialis TaxID=139415 RepID=UPI00200788FE|nr:uncharacterized protein B0H18DRAFT_951180 [Neoantrodia serialis]KAH9935717.1 hypothetical protein B0H18DRAFT_951180 [Neoantrodia serialis]